jgi:hypothetical protein
LALRGEIGRMSAEEHYVCPKHVSAYAAGLLARIAGNRRTTEMRIRLERIPDRDPLFDEFRCTVCGAAGVQFLLRPLEGDA